MKVGSWVKFNENLSINDGITAVFNVDMSKSYQIEEVHLDNCVKLKGLPRNFWHLSRFVKPYKNLPKEKV